MSRVRSPNYPQLSLPDAIARVEQIFNKEHRHPASKEVIVQHLGYSGVNGASLGALSALGKYGLLERAGDDYRVSERAVTILHPESEAEKVAALRDAAFSPVLFSELLAQFEGRLPSDENLRSTLVRRGFAPSALSGVIAVLRDTMDLVSDAESNSAKATATVHPGGQVHAATQAMRPATIHAQPASLSGQGNVVVPARERFRISMTDVGLEIAAALCDRRDVAKLITILQTMQNILPESSDIGSLEAPAASLSYVPTSDDGN